MNRITKRPFVSVGSTALVGSTGLVCWMGLICLISLALARPLVGQSPAESKIRDVLEGKETPGTNNGFLEDVLGVIRHQGSILDGSSLDPGNEPSGNGPPENGDSSPSSPDQIKARRCHAAEQLLKAARLLSSVESSPEAAKLIDSMRNQATDLLLENRAPSDR